MLAVAVDEGRVRAVADAFKALGLGWVLAVEEGDPQFKALKGVGEVHGVKATCLVAVLNALVSYMLTGRGEEYWSELSSYMRRARIRSADDALRAVLGFLKASRVNVLYRDVKARRLLRFASSGAHRVIYEGVDHYAEDLGSLWRLVARGVDAPLESKTVVFAVKMFYYAYRAVTGRLIDVPMEIPVPLDRRLVKLTLSSRLVRAPEALRLGRLTPSDRRLMIKAWSMVSARSGIPPLNLDAPLWITGRALSSPRDPLGEAVALLSKAAGPRWPLDPVRRLVSLLLGRA